VRLSIVIVSALTLFSAVQGVPQEPAADQHPDFTGVWRLDLDASTSLDAMLKLQGISRFKRHAMAKTVVTQTIEQQPDRITIHVDSKHRHAVEDLVLDGRFRPATTPDGQKITRRAFWTDGGRAVVAEARVVLKDGRPAVLRTERRMAEDGATLVMLVILTAEDGTRLEATRIFRRVPTEEAS